MIFSFIIFSTHIRLLGLDGDYNCSTVAGSTAVAAQLNLDRFFAFWRMAFLLL